MYIYLIDAKLFIISLIKTMEWWRLKGHRVITVTLLKGVFQFKEHSLSDKVLVIILWAIKGINSILQKKREKNPERSNIYKYIGKSVGFNFKFIFLQNDIYIFYNLLYNNYFHH